MSRQGRILVVDDLPRWQGRLTRSLKRSGFAVDAAASIDEALQKLDSALYHLAVLDIRMVDSDSANVEGMGLLRELNRRGSLGAIKIVMLSAYGTKGQMREAFTRHGVKDFFEKDDFGDGSEFRERIEKIFADEIGVNLDLEVQWEPADAAQQVVNDLRLGEGRVKKHPEMAERVAEELDDLLGRLLPRARRVKLRPLAQGMSGAAVLWAQWETRQGAAAEPEVLKIGDVRDIEKEHQSFKAYVEGFVGGNRNTTARTLRRTPLLGGIAYSFIGVEGRQLEDFGAFYQRSDPATVAAFLDQLFLKTCGRWYGNPGPLDPRDLNAEYRGLLGFTEENLRTAVRDMLTSVQMGEDGRLSFQSFDGGRTFTNPIPAGAERPFLRSTYATVTHGDFNHHNILVDEAGHPWLIDFLRTGSGHILRDVAQLDSVVRLQLLGPKEATLPERLAMEEALSGIEFQQATEVPRLETANPALAKAFGTAAHLRRLAARLVAQNPDADVSEYQIASLYYSLNAVRFYSLKKTQREHALLSASLLADRIGL